VSVFGSVARGGSGTRSDVDLLLDTGGPLSLFERAALRGELEDLLGCPVHVLTTGGLSCARENTRAQIEREAISL
jgi:predicted nucleotidyltransferase